MYVIIQSDGNCENGYLGVTFVGAYDTLDEAREKMRESIDNYVKNVVMWAKHEGWDAGEFVDIGDMYAIASDNYIGEHEGWSVWHIFDDTEPNKWFSI